MQSRTIRRGMRLTSKLETLLLQAVRTSGSFHPREALNSIEEQLTLSEFNAATAFLDWVFISGLTFGHANIHERFKEFQDA
jgi:hypothetical protein